MRNNTPVVVCQHSNVFETNKNNIKYINTCELEILHRAFTSIIHLSI